ncbi:hypothetical protein ACP70R_045252 [Stipagrostis hirtigluma subsp. patula]
MAAESMAGAVQAAGVGEAPKRGRGSPRGSGKKKPKPKQSDPKGRAKVRPRTADWAFSSPAMRPQDEESWARFASLAPRCPLASATESRGFSFPARAAASPLSLEGRGGEPPGGEKGKRRSRRARGGGEGQEEHVDPLEKGDEENPLQSSLYFFYPAISMTFTTLGNLFLITISGEYRSRFVKMVCKVLKAYYLSSRESTRAASVVSPESRIEEALGSCLLPSLQLIPANPAVDMEIWGFFPFFLTRPAIDYMVNGRRRLSRIQLSLLQGKLQRVEAYRDMTTPIVDTFKYLTQLEYDILQYIVIEHLAQGGREKLKDDGLNLSDWLQCLASFWGHLRTVGSNEDAESGWTACWYC